MPRYWPRFVAACRRRYGSVFTLRIASVGPLVYLDDPADIKMVFAGSPTIYHAGEANSLLAGFVGDSSVLVIDEDLHHDRRRLMIAPFQRDAVARQAGVMAEIAAANISRWPVGTEFSVAPKMSEITLEVILRSVIGATEAGDEYLDAIAKETLRIRPVVFDVGRVLTQPVELAGYRLPAGVMVAPGIGLVHASPRQYPDPDRFDPGRMLGATLSPTTWLPFGGGNRRCLGATFAMAEMRIVLREVLRRVELRTSTAPGERQRVKHVILAPHRGARIHVNDIRKKVMATAAATTQLPGCPITTAHNATPPP